MNLGEYQIVIDFDLEGPVSWKNNDFLFFLIEESLQSEASSVQIGIFEIPCWRLVDRKAEMFDQWPNFSLDNASKFLVLSRVMTRTPAVKVTISTMLNLDMHQSYILILLRIIFISTTNHQLLFSYHLLILFYNIISSQTFQVKSYSSI